MDAESQLLAEQDAEIQRLKNQPVLIFEALYAEIERYQEIVTGLRERARDKDKLITELCDALLGPPLSIAKLDNMLQRAREATR